MHAQCIVMKSTDHFLQAEYDAAFERERARDYSEVTELERRLGYSVERERLEACARVLACPVKVNAPNWQHGRVLYALARHYLACTYHAVTFLDIGTAKGFSACVMSWAIADAGMADTGHAIASVDIVDPDAFIKRNSVAEVEKLQTVQQFVKPFIAPDVSVTFHGGGSAKWLREARAEKVNVGFAFIDGKHTFDAVMLEFIGLTKLQRTGDLLLFDDVQFPDIEKAVMRITGYRRQRFELQSVRRAYTWAVKN